MVAVGAGHNQLLTTFSPQRHRAHRVRTEKQPELYVTHHIRMSFSFFVRLCGFVVEAFIGGPAQWSPGLSPQKDHDFPVGKHAQKMKKTVCILSFSCEDTKAQRTALHYSRGLLTTRLCESSVRSVSLWWPFVAIGCNQWLTTFSPQRHRGHRVRTETDGYCQRQSHFRPPI